MKKFFTEIIILSLITMLGIHLLIIQTNRNAVVNAVAQMSSITKDEDRWYDRTLTGEETYVSNLANTVAAIDAQLPVTNIEIEGYVIGLKALNFQLTAELLSYSLEPAHENTIYSPEFGHIITYSPQFRDILNLTDNTKNIKWDEFNPITGKGTGWFPSGNNYKEKDAYYGIHNFEFTRTVAPNGVLTIVFEDYFDFNDKSFSYGDDSIIDMFIHRGYEAQELGIIKNFTTRIVYTSSTPYYLPVTNHEDLDAIRYFPNLNFQLMNNIILHNTNWIPISSFYGILNGNNYLISSMKITLVYDDLYANRGFFETLSGTVKNLYLDVKISTSELSINPYMNIGGLAGTMFAGASAQKVVIYGDIDATGRSNACVGGIVGYNMGTITAKCHNMSNISGSGDIGGIAGKNMISIENSYNSGEISYIYKSIGKSIGGIAGINQGYLAGNFNYTTGQIISTRITNETYMGTIVGNNYPTFNTTNINNATWSVTYSDGQDGYLFKQSGGRVGRQEGVAPPSTGGGKCFAPGTLVTLADGTQVPVELLTGDERLLVWNFHTGAFDSAPIIFIDNEASAQVETIRLIFTRGAEVTIIYEHGFWDLTLNKYVWLNAENATEFIGHEFMQQIIDKKGNMTRQSIKLVNVQIRTEYTTAWSPVTYSHFSLFVNGILSVPAETDKLLNIFAVDAETLMYDVEAYQADIAEFGLLSYEEFSEYLPGLPEIFFDAFNGQYLLVAMGRGLVTWEDLSTLVERYSQFFL